MLEGVVTWVLNNYVGEYLENLNADQLSIALLQGQVELENVPLKKTALRKFDIPLQVRSGIIGKLTLSIPITHMRSEPWILKMSDLLILLGPSNGNYDAQDVEGYELTKKEQMLEALENEHKKQLLMNLGVPFKDDTTQNQYWGASVFSAVSNNIQLILSNVHIRYEDDQTMPDNLPFSFGIRIQHISVQTTNSLWKSEFVQPQDGVNTFKKLDIKGFSVFWNCHQPVVSKIDTLTDLKNVMAPENSKNLSFILQPLSMQVRMEKNTSKFPLKTIPAIPRFKFDLRPEKINIELSKKQLAQIRLLTREWTRFDRARQHRKWRPLMSIKDNPSAWWKFAIGRILEETHQNRQRSSKKFLLTRANHLNGYCKAYRQKLEAYLADQLANATTTKENTPKVSAMSAIFDDTTFMKQIEHDSQFTYHELHLFRETVFRRMMREKMKDKESKNDDSGSNSDVNFELVSPDSDGKKIISTDEVDINPEISANQGGLYNWFTGWFSSGSSNEEKTDEDDVNEANLLQMWPNIQEKDLPPNLKRVERKIEEEILDVLNESWDDSTILRRDNLLAEVVLRLERMIVRFVDEELNGNSRVVAMDMRHVASRFQLSPREHRTEISLSVGDMSVQRLKISPNLVKDDDKSDITSLSSESVEDEEESLVFGFGSMPKVAPQLLFAIGRAREDSGENGMELTEKVENLVIMTEGEQKSKKPLFQMIYRRMAPRLNVLHELDAKFAPVSVIYDEDAVNGLANLFDTESAIFDKKLPDDDFTGLESVGETQCFLNFVIPFVLFELRSRRTSLAHNIPEPISAPFACAKITNVDIGISKNEPLLTKLKISLSSLTVEDLYEKAATMPLIRTVENAKSLATMTSLSNSCPDLHDETQRFITLSSSLPQKLEFKPVFNNNPRITAEDILLQPHISRKIPPAKFDNDFGVGNPDRPLLNFVFVDSKHPEFETKYSKKNCIIDGEFSGIDVAMNRRSWTMLLDFFGVLGVKTEKSEDEPDQISLSGIDEKYLELLYGKDAANDIKIQNELSNAKLLTQNATTNAQKKEDYLMHLNLTVGTGRIFMTYPKNQTQLGMLISNSLELDVKINVANPLEPLLMKILTTELFLHDTTPFYSRFYSERMSLKPRDHQESKNHSKIEIDILKYRTNDPYLKRDCDMKMKIISTESSTLHYIHTHRFFCGLMDFWFNFAELQDSVRKMNEQVIVEEESLKMRTIIELSLPGGLTLILPLNQFSDQVIILEMATVEITNLFDLASRTKELLENCVDIKCLDDDYDCLLEKMMIDCKDITIHEGYRISVDKIDENQHSNDFKNFYNKKIGHGFFQNYYFLMEENGILTRKYDLHVDVFKNLSSFISHNVPELTILSKFDNIDLVFTTDFYCLLRGFLEKNLGEQLIPIPETIPVEILQNPEKGFAAAASEKYLTLSFRLSFENVEIHFKVPENPRFPRCGKFKKFGKVGLHKARISFDAFIDSISEFDLICESTELIDTRFDDLEDKDNVFPLILQSRTKETPTNDSMMKLMSEAHIMMKKDEAPTVTLVLQNSRIVLILDWLNNAKDFFLLNTTFVPPEEPTTMKYGFGAPKDGIVTRIPDSKNEMSQNLHTITLKITLRDSDLILLEEPKNKDSLSLFCFTTCVLNLNDKYGIFEGNLEIQKMCCSWAVLSNEELTKCQISNDFSITINLQKDIKPLKESAAELLQSKEMIQNSSNPVTKLFETILPKQKMQIEMSEMVARVSYKDILVLKSVLEGSLSRLQSSFENSMIPKRNELPGKPPFVIQKVFFNSNHFCLWFLDDSQGIALPILRLILTNLNIEYSTDERITSKLQLGVDYFNQRVFGWEPFIETWKIDELTFRWKKYHLNMVLHPAIDSPLDFNVTNTLIQHAKHFLSKWTAIKKNLDRDFRNLCTRSRADHLPYLLKNETGTNLLFTTNVEEVLRARSDSRKSSAKWFSATAGKSCTFEFPTKRLIAKEKVSDPRQLIVRVEGWDEISPVDVDSVGTYFRVTKMNNATVKKDPPRARVVVAVTMDPDGRKVVTIRSALLTVNQLPDPILLKFNNRFITNPQEVIEIKLEPGEKYSVPLKFVNSEMEFMPCSPLTPVGSQQVDWRSAKVPGDIVNQTVKFRTNDPGKYYWACVSVKREHYPEYESLSGHTIVFIPPMTLLNLLPVEIQFIIGDNQKYSVGAGGRLLIMDIDLNQEMKVAVRTEQFKSVKPVFIQRSNYAERGITEDKKIDMQMIDGKNRLLDMYGSIYVTRGSALHLSIWVPYWIVNRSGIPLIIKQEATENDAAGQFQDHERAKDRNPLMFSFSDPNCPQACTVRVGNKFERDPEYKPQYCPKFELSSGVQAIKLLLTHEQQATLMYDVGIEVRQCTGRYKDTQVVLFTPRYRLNNQSSTQLFVCHQEDIKKPNHHVPLASKCNLIWHETFEDKKRLCVKRIDVEHWSCPFRLDQIGSFHITMRSRDETPQFVRVEVALSGASFWVTFTDSIYFPAPIKIRNLSNVPVLYQQSSKEFNRFRTICKANSTVDYSWDDLYGEKLLTLQVYENKSHSYDPSKPKRGPSLTYENYFYIQFLPSFQRNSLENHKDAVFEGKELVLEALVNGKVVLNSLNIADSSQRQLWKFGIDGSLENVGMNHTAKQGERFVLDVLEASGFALMVVNRTETRNVTQRWRFTNDGRLCCGLKDMFVENVGKSKIVLSRPKKEVPRTHSNIPEGQNFIMQHQKPGSGILDVECLHVGPTLVIQITDRLEPVPVSIRSSRSSKSPTRNGTILSQRISRTREDSTSFMSVDVPWNLDAEIQLPSGIGISVINLHNEELIYARFQGVQLHLCRIETTYQFTGHVNLIQIDNQLLTTEKWPILYCQVNALKDIDDNSDPSLSMTDINLPIRPALKLEMNCTPKEHYDAFDCFRLKLCDMCVLLDETLLWKIFQFIQETDSADVVSQSTLLQPPNIEPDMNVPGTSDGTPTRRCYFGTLDLEVGNVALTVITVAKNGLPKDLQLLKRQFNIKLVSFENALITLSPFRQFHYFETMKFLVASLSKFYLLELQKQTVNIIFTMDAFGNPRGLATDLRDSFQGLIFEVDITGFVAGVGYGVTNSLSKVASSMSHGIGSLTYDEEHELMRKRLLRMQPQSDSNAALSHLCNGVKGLGFGVLGAVTAMYDNTKRETKKDGFSGIFKGIAKGAVDTVTKPVQGVFDLLEGTASAMKEVVGSQQLRKSRFPDQRVRLPRVCNNLQLLLPPYSTALAEAQQELLRINGYMNFEALFDMEIILRRRTHDNIEQRVLICSDQCYCLRQINDNPASVVQRIAYRYFKNIHIDPTTDVGKGLICIAVVYDSNQMSMQSPRLVCDSHETARRLCEKILRAKQLYDHSKRTLAVKEDFDNLQI